MDYENKYKELLARLQKAKENEEVNDERYCCVIDDVVPELKESEDEKVRKWLLDFVQGLPDEGLDFHFYNLNKEQVIAWLEKQVPVHLSHDDEIMIRQLTEYFTTGKGLQNTNDTVVEWLEDIKRKLEKQGENNMGISESTRQKLEDNLNKALEKETPESWNEFLEKQPEQTPIKRKDFISIPFGAFDSELIEETITIPDGCVATIEGNRIHIKRKSKSATEAIKEEKVDNANKVEPKFKVGDWVVLSNHNNKDAVYRVEDNSATETIKEEKVDKPFDYENANIVQKDFVPKFEFGDWIVQENIGVYQVIQVCESWYEAVDNKGKGYSIGFDKEHMLRLWTIQDAKDGDVLATEDWIFIFEKMNSNGKPACHCHYDIELGFRIDANSYIATGSEIYPATKEQHDLLFQKMKEEGYEWDSEKKELIKLDEQAPTGDANYADQIDEYKGLTDLEKILTDICSSWIGFELGWQSYIKSNARILKDTIVKQLHSMQDESRN